MNIKQFLKPNRVKMIVSAACSLTFSFLNFPFYHCCSTGGGCIQGGPCGEPVFFFNLSNLVLDILIGFAVSYLIVCFIIKCHFKKLFLNAFIISLAVIVITLVFLFGDINFFEVGTRARYCVFLLFLLAKAIGAYSLVGLLFAIWFDRKKFLIFSCLGIADTIILLLFLILLILARVYTDYAIIVINGLSLLFLAFLCCLRSICSLEKRFLWYLGYLILIIIAVFMVLGVGSQLEAIDIYPYGVY